MFKKIFLPLVAILILTIVSFQLQPDKPIDSLEKIPDGITQEEIKRHISYLASDELEGRMTASQGGRQAAEYIAKIFENNGLKPGGDNDSYYQNFFAKTLMPSRGIPVLGKNNSLSLKTTEQNTNLELNKDFVPLVFSVSKKLADTPVVFAGYGITSLEHKYDDYKKSDVKNKMVFILKHEPFWEKSSSKSASLEYTKHAWFSTKLRRAQNNGAAGVILVTGSHGQEDDPDVLEPFQPNRILSMDKGNAINIPVVQITRKVAQRILNLANQDLSKLQHTIDSSLKPFSFEIPDLKIDLEIDINYKKVSSVAKQSRNVIGYIEGSNPHLKQQAVIIGAHYDHIGLGHWGSRDYLVGQAHNGADDNASGTTAVILLAKTFSQLATKPKRSIIFIAFDAEEMGWLGSKYYVEHPLFSAKQTVLMINFDMIGRSVSRRMYVAMNFNLRYLFLLSKICKNRFKNDIKLCLRRGTASSDDTSFYRKGIPVCAFYDGGHKDYHCVSDDVDKIKTDVMETLCKLVFRYVYAIANR